MKIDLALLPTMWYENEKGERYIPLQDSQGNCENPSPPPGFIFHSIRVPCSIQEEMFRCTEDGEVPIATLDKTWPEDLVLAMARPTWWAAWRTRYTLSEAILIVSTACERCRNVLGDRYGMKWGYKEGSEEWEECGTGCQFCEDRKGDVR